MFSILNLAMRCRPLANRLINTRNLGIAHRVYTKSCQRKSVTTIRFIATTAWQASANKGSEPPAKHANRSEYILKIFMENSPVTMPFVSFNELKTAINAKLTTENAIGLMVTCSKLVDRSVTERVKLIDAIWAYLKKTRETLPYVSLIESYRHSGRAMHDPHLFLALIGASKDVQIYEEVIRLMCANNPSIVGAYDLLQHMQNIGMTATEQTYAALIVGTATHTKSMEKVGEILLTMDRQQLERTIETEVALIKANIECGHEQQAIEMLKQRNDWEGEQLFAIIRLVAMKCTGDEVVKQALGLLPAGILNAKHIAGGIRNVCRQLLHASNDDRFYDPFELIIRHLPAPDSVNENNDHYGEFLLYEMLSCTPLPRIVQFSKQLIASGRNKNILLPRYFRPMFDRAKSEDQIIKIIKLAAETQTVLDATTIENHIFPKLPLKWNEPMMTLKTLEKLGLKMLPLQTSIISYLLRDGRLHKGLNMAEAVTDHIDALHLKKSITICIYTNRHRFTVIATTIVHLIRVVQSKTTDQQYDLAGKVLHHVSSQNSEVRQRFRATLQLLQELTAAELKISSASAEAVLNCLGEQHDVYEHCAIQLRAITDNTHFSSNEKQPTTHNDHMSMEEMENQLIELESQQADTRRLVGKLFPQCVWEKKYDRAMELHIKYIANKAYIGPAALSATIDLMNYRSNAQEALNALDILQREFPCFNIRLYKIVQLADLLVKENRLTDAEAILNRFADDTRKINMNYIQQRIWDLLQTTAEWSIQNKCPENTAQMMLNKLVKMGYCKHTNRTLTPVIREYIGKGQIIAAIDKLEAMVNKYRTAPLLDTLMTLLIELMNAGDEDERWQLYELNRPLANEKLHKITGIGRTLYKPDKVNTHLLISFAIAGSEQQIRSFLSDPAMKIDVDRLISQMDYHLNTLGKFESVIKLAKCIRGLRYEAISEDNLYSLLVDRFAVANNHAAALALYSEICKDPDYKMPEKLKQKFDAIFARNNIEIKS